MALTTTSTGVLGSFTVANATPLTGSATIYEQNTYSNLGSAYSVNATAGQVIKGEAWNDSFNGNLEVAIFDSTGLQLAEANAANAMSAIATATAATTGVYYILFKTTAPSYARSSIMINTSARAAQLAVSAFPAATPIVLTTPAPTPAPAPAPAPTPAPAPAPAPTTTDAQIAADKLTVASLKNRVKNGDTLIDDEAIMMKVGDSALVTQIMSALDAGGGYDALRLLGVSEAMSVDVLGMYSMKPDATRYEREIGVDAIIQTKTRLKDFLNYLDTHSISYPPLSGLFSAIRANNATYEALRQWNKTRTA